VTFFTWFTSGLIGEFGEVISSLFYSRKKRDQRQDEFRALVGSLPNLEQLRDGCLEYAKANFGGMVFCALETSVVLYKQGGGLSITVLVRPVSMPEAKPFMVFADSHHKMFWFAWEFDPRR
jgi:hypothetical protein